MSLNRSTHKARLFINQLTHHDWKQAPGFACQFQPAQTLGGRVTTVVIWPLPPTWGTWTEFLAPGSGPSSHGSASTGSGLAATLQGRPTAGGPGCPATACGSCSQPRLRAPPTVSVTPFMMLRDGDERHRHEVADVVPLNSRGGGGGREGGRHTEHTCCAVSPPHGQEDTLPCPLTAVCSGNASPECTSKSFTRAKAAARLAP